MENMWNMNMALASLIADLGAFFLLGISAAVFAIAIAVTISSFYGNFPVRPVILYWLLIAVTGVALYFINWHLGFWIGVIGSLAFIPVLVHYDSVQSRSKNLQSNSASDVSRN